ncbi:hypothetical protein J1605_010747 [Eschrichtius robustus]|uniref:HECT domain-containing protein n=1 Tax=Eschrichtius robustus TaxID=9764 RepID=A0AB34GR79_ESCRO|nr:hypothetical protein J1605_010747 [Eschrichtius robustus]
MRGRVKFSEKKSEPEGGPQRGEVEFIKEIRSVGEGVKSEFFHCIFEDMTKKEYGMFIYPEEGSYVRFLVNNSRYGPGYCKSHPTILMFWNAFHKLTLDEKRKFLFFLTGNERLHVKGVRKVGILFRCPETFSERDFSRSLTCHNILDLPKYSTMERMEEALQVAINSNKGFISPTVTE